MDPATSLVREIEYLPRLFEATLGMSGDVEGLGELKAAQAKSIMAKIKQIGFICMPDAIQLKAAMGKVGWSKEQNITLSGCVDESMKSDGLKLPNRRPSQNISTWELYPDQADWTVMMDPDAPWSVKLARAARVCERIRLVLPTEHVRARIIEILLVANGTCAERDKGFYKLFDKFGSMMEPLGKVHHKDLPHIVNFPASPKDLPREIYREAYADGAQPALRQLNGLPLLGTSGVRKNSRAYKMAFESEAKKDAASNSATMAMPTQSRAEAAAKLSQELGTHGHFPSAEPYAQGWNMRGWSEWPAQGVAGSRVENKHAAPWLPVKQECEEYGEQQADSYWQRPSFSKGWRDYAPAQELVTPRDKAAPPPEVKPAQGLPAQGRTSGGMAYPPEVKPAQGLPAQGNTVWGVTNPTKPGRSVAFNADDADDTMRRAMRAREGKKKKTKKTKKTEPEQEEACGKKTDKKTGTKKSKRAVQKKPAANVAKTPAAVYTKPKTFPWTTKDKNSTKNCYCSRFYGRTKTLLRKAGWDEEATTEELRRVYQLCSTIHEKHVPTTHARPAS